MSSKLPDKFEYRSNSGGVVFAWDRASNTAFRVDSFEKFVPISDPHTSTKVRLSMSPVSREEAERLLKPAVKNLPDTFEYRTNSGGVVFAWDEESWTASRVDSFDKWVEIKDPDTSLKVCMRMPVISREEAESLLSAYDQS